MTEPGADGKPAWKPRPAEELDRLAALVRGTIGFDEKRVTTSRSSTCASPSEDAVAEAGPRRLLGVPVGNLDVGQLAQTGVFALVALLGLLLVLRPMVRRLVAPPDGLGDALALAGPDGSGAGGPGPLLAGNGASAGGAVGLLTGPPGAVARLAAPGAEAEDDSMVELANIQGQMRASSIRRVAAMVDRHPDESLSIVRAWLHQEAA